MTLNRYHVILVIASVLAFLSAAAIITLIILWQTILSPFQDYSIVIDAGSTGTRIYLYTWPADKSDGLGTTSRISQVQTCDISSGALTSIDVSVINSVKNYFNVAMTNCTSSIPDTRKSRSLIFLGGTAGLRIANLSNPIYVSNLLNQTRSYFSTLGLLFLSPENQVRIISGSEEGLSGWITTNLLANEFFDNDPPSDTYGVFDMGGASTQISFIASNAIDNRYTLNLFDENYDVYSHSYLCYGQDQLRLVYQGVLIQQANGSTIINDPCLQIGSNQSMNYSSINSTPCGIQKYVAPINFTSSTIVTFQGTGNYNQCQTLMYERFDKTLCASIFNCSFNGVYQPIPVSSSLKFMIISAFYTTFITLAPYIPLTADSQGNFQLNSTNLTQIYAAIQTVCNQPWSNLTNPDKYRPLLCFNSVYHWTLFTYAYSFTSTNVNNFQIVKTVNSTTIGWTLGYMINQTNYLDPEYRPARLLTRAEFIGIIICFVVLLVIGLILIFLSIFLLRRRRINKLY